MKNKQYDVVVLGASGFTGKWVAKYLFDNYVDTDLRWAMAGRNITKLHDIRDFIGDKGGNIDCIIADSDDEGSLRDLAQATKVVITTVGPYAFYGSKLVKVCAEEGTHYVDLTGEVPWMRQMIDQYQTIAQENGAKIVHCCGFDSIPSDIGNWFMQQNAMEIFKQPLQKMQYSLIKAKGGASGGTIHSLLNVMEQATSDKAIRRVMFNPYSLNPDPSFKGKDGRDQTGMVFNEDFNRWTAPFVMSAINCRVVRRSNALLDFAWGEDFQYSESMATGTGVGGYVKAASVTGGLGLLSALAITQLGRKLLAKMLPAQGEGPKIDPENPGFYVIALHGKTAAGEVLKGKITADADPGYGSTSKMLAEAGISLAKDDLPEKSGFLTPSSAMGDALLQRLQANAGLTFSITD